MMTFVPGTCSGCGRPARNALAGYCDFCTAMHDRRNAEFRPGMKITSEVVNTALKASYSATTGRFHCAISGVDLVEADPDHPAHAQLEHSDPSDTSSVAIAAQVINQMKGNMSFDHFKALVVELGKKFDGQPYNEIKLRDLVYAAPKVPRSRGRSA